jgi:hypothetical protein
MSFRPNVNDSPFVELEVLDDSAGGDVSLLGFGVHVERRRRAAARRNRDPKSDKPRWISNLRNCRRRTQERPQYKGPPNTKYVVSQKR